MRDDLRCLTPEALAALANWGLVKRAQREPAATLEEREGTLTATFPDGNVCTFPAGQPAHNSACSCGASAWCRHRIAAILACSAGGSAELPVAPPCELDLPALERWAGKRLCERARQLRQRGMRVELVGPPWQVRLPTCTVRLLAGNDIHYLRCDCDRPAPCEHLVLAGWVVRELQGRAGTLEWRGPPAPTESDFGAWKAILPELLHAGVAQASLSWQARGRKAAAEAERCSWLQLLLGEMQALSAAYVQGASGYDPARWLFVLLSAWARLHANDGLSAAYRLGSDVPLEQEMEQTRLVSLGARRVGAEYRLYWADPAGQVLTQSTRGTVTGLGHAETLARSQLVSAGLLRRADGTIRLRRERQKHSLSPVGAAWEGISPQLHWPGWQAWSSRSREAPPTLLRPLHAAEGFTLLRVVQTHDCFYEPGQQAVVALLEDHHGGMLRLRRVHHRDAPGALDVLVSRLRQARWISGTVGLHEGLPTLDPVALWDGFVLSILDLDSAPPYWELPHRLHPPGASGLEQLLAETASLCQETAHLGLAQLLSSFQTRRLALAERLEQAGMGRLAAALGGEWNETTFWNAALRSALACERLPTLARAQPGAT